MNLHEFYTHPSYDQTPEITAIQPHITNNTLFVGNYSATLAKHFPETYAALPDQNLLFALQTDNDADIKYAGASTNTLPYPDNSFEVIISAYNMTHKNKQLLQELKRVSKHKLIIIEADTESAYTQILQNIKEKPLTHPQTLLEELSQYNIIEEIIESTYTFNDKKEFSNYIQTELQEHENETIPTEEIQTHYQQTIQEKALMLVCEK